MLDSEQLPHLVTRVSSNVLSQDVGFPYMCMPAHLEDTLFLFFESDFRFWKEDCIAPELWLRLAAQSCREPLASITGRRGSQLRAVPLEPLA